MIQKKINEIDIADIQQLIELEVAESKTIEYKKELKIATDSDKKEFLSDIASFANTNGGDLIFGLEATGGIPTTISRLTITDLDAEKLRLEAIIRNGIDPKILFTLHPIGTDVADEYVLLIRINESWNKPHRVIYGGSNRFCARNSAGKYDLDVTELRQVFTLADTVEKRIQDFRTERLFAVESGKTFLPLRGGKIVAIHFFPLESFSTKLNIDRDMLISLESETTLFEPMYSGSQWHSPRINLEGAVSFSGRTGEYARSYIQLFRNGVLEMVETSMLDGESIPYALYEKEIVDNIKKAIRIYQRLEVNTPIFVSLSLLNVGGMTMADNQRTIRREGNDPIRQKDLILPEITITDYGQSIEKTMQPIFDLVWNACGLRKSENYNNAGDFLL